jgi:tryptophan synthase beta chain
MADTIAATPAPPADRFGPFGGRYVPETLIPALDELDAAFDGAMADPAFRADLDDLLRTYVGRPSPLSAAPRLSALVGAPVWMKREDLNHTGAHKINNTVGRCCSRGAWGKRRIIAETGAGQHGVATATGVRALRLECVVYMGEEDMRRQSLNVWRMRLMGATVVPVTAGTRTLKDATSEAIRDWVTTVETSHYIIGSVVGPAPYPRMVREFQAAIGARRGRSCSSARAAAESVVACVGGGSNAMGVFAGLRRRRRRRARRRRGGGRGARQRPHSASLTLGTPGVLHGALSYLLQDAKGQVINAHSISAGSTTRASGPSTRGSSRAGARPTCRSATTRRSRASCSSAGSRA